MAEKKTTQKKKAVELYGKKYDINEMLPESFLSSKLNASEKYIPVNIYRDIMRQIGEFDIPVFKEEKKLLQTSDGGKILYQSDVEIAWGEKTLRGSGWHVVSAKALLSSAAHGNMHTLRAKALRDALKYSYKIFEFPEPDMAEPEPEENVKVAVKKEEPKKDVKKEDKKVDKKETTKDGTVINDDNIIQELIQEKYEEYVKKYIKDEWNGDENLTKQCYLLIGSSLKKDLEIEDGSEEYKILQKIVAEDYNKATD